jgi:hypothetical protein
VRAALQGFAVTTLHGVEVPSADLGPQRTGNLAVTEFAKHTLQSTVGVGVAAATMVVVTLLLTVLLLVEHMILALANGLG